MSTLASSNPTEPADAQTADVPAADTADRPAFGPDADLRTPCGITLFANPYSGSGPNRQWVQQFADRLGEAGLPPQIVWDASNRRDTLRRCAETLRSDASPPWVIAAGGDGSVAAVLNDMAAVGVAPWPFATLPVGNENLFARHFGIDRKKPDRLIDALLRGWTRPVDLGRLTVDGDDASPLRFTLMASVGFDADVVHRVDRWRTNTPAEGQIRRVSLKNYLPRMAGALREYAYPPVTLTPTDGDHAGQPLSGRHAFVFNLPEYGKDLGLCRHARADDGMLDFVVFTRPGRVRLLNYLAAAAMNGRHLRRPDVIHGRASRLTLAADSEDHGSPVPLQADGDPAGHVRSGAPVTITAEPAALRVVQTTA
ncbi:MAG: diacylglycerol kinase family protein [Planctomycetota bacterium]